MEDTWKTARGSSRFPQFPLNATSCGGNVSGWEGNRLFHPLPLSRTRTLSRHTRDRVLKAMRAASNHENRAGTWQSVLEGALYLVMLTPD